MKKTLQLVLLPTQNKSDLCLGIRQPDKPLLNYYKSLQYDCSNDKNIINQHLYAISNENPKLGDFIICYGADGDGPPSILKYTGEELGITKIIITTDESLEVFAIDSQIGENNYQSSLPKFTDEFINSYINRYNSGNMINEVEVEYDQNIQANGIENLMKTDYYTKFPEELPNCVFESVLKVNPDNTVNVSLIEDKLYTKEKVTNLLRSAWVTVSGSYGDILNETDFNDFINENL